MVCRDGHSVISAFRHLSNLTEEGGLVEMRPNVPDRKPGTNVPGTIKPHAIPKKRQPQQKPESDDDDN